MSDGVVLRRVVANVAAAYFRSRRVAPADIATVIAEISNSFSGVSRGAADLDRQDATQAPAEAAWPRKLSARQIRSSITPDGLISFEDGKPYRSLGRHLAARGMSLADYRSKWGLPADYPSIAPSLRALRSRPAAAGHSEVLDAPQSAQKDVVIEGGEALQQLTTEPVGSPADAPSSAPASLIPPPAALPLEPELTVPDRAAPPPPKLRLALTQPASALARLTAGFKLNPRPQAADQSTAIPKSFRPLTPAGDQATAERCQRLLSMLSERDWARIKAVARQVNPAHTPPVLTDFSAPLRVRVCMVGQETKFSGERVGTLRGGQVALLIAEADGIMA